MFSFSFPTTKYQYAHVLLKESFNDRSLKNDFTFIFLSVIKIYAEVNCLSWIYICRGASLCSGNLHPDVSRPGRKLITQDYRSTTLSTKILKQCFLFVLLLLIEFADLVKGFFLSFFFLFNWKMLFPFLLWQYGW